MNQSTTVRVSEEIKNKLKEIAKKEGVSIQFAIEKAVNYYQRITFLEELNKAYAENKNINKEPVYDSAISDGLDNEEWNEHGELVKKGYL